jgi:hypothetical protein
MSAKTLRRLLPLLMLMALPARPDNKTGTVTATRNLALGRFVASTGGTITLTPDGVRSSTGGVILLAGGSATSATFSLTESGTGAPLTWTSISLPPSATLTGAGASMTLTNFTSNPDHRYIAGAQDLAVGATLQVSPDQAAGNYVGSFAVSINYE